MKDKLIKDENTKYYLEYLKETDEIESEDLELRFEDSAGRDTGCDIRIQEIARLALERIEELEGQLNQ